jgi:hypothetical protein
MENTDLEKTRKEYTFNFSNIFLNLEILEAARLQTKRCDCPLISSNCFISKKNKKRTDFLSRWGSTVYVKKLLPIMLHK